MQAQIQAFIQGLPYAAIYGLSAIALLLLGTVVYVILTPHKELKLLRSGNSSAGLALAGTVIGLALPLAAALRSSLGLVELLCWGFVTVLVQLLCFRFVDLLLHDLRKRIAEDQAGAAIMLVGVNIAVALIVAAAVSDPNIRLS